MAKSTHGRNKVLTPNQSPSICLLLKWQVMRFDAFCKQENKKIKIKRYNHPSSWRRSIFREHYNLINKYSNRKGKDAGSEMGRDVKKYIGFLKLYVTRNISVTRRWIKIGIEMRWNNNDHLQINRTRPLGKRGHGVIVDRDRLDQGV